MGCIPVMKNGLKKQRSIPVYNKKNNYDHKVDRSTPLQEVFYGNE